MLAVLLTLLLALMAPSVVLVDHVEAATDSEQRCRDLGANCICSEPLNTSTLTVENTNWIDPADSTLKPCDFLGDGSGKFFETLQGLTGTNSATLMDALPAGHANSFVARAPSGMAGSLFAGTKVPGGTPTARRAMRAYVYFSNPYQLTSNGTCGNNGKLTQLGGTGGIVTNAFGGSWGMYSWGASADQLWIASPVVNASSAQPDCCSSGPGTGSGAQAALSLSSLQGKWVRVEYAIHNAAGTPGFQFKLWMKNVTDNGPEYTVIDTSLPCTTAVCGPGTGWISPDYTNNFRPAGGQALNDLWLDLFRNGTCTGYMAVSHYMAAAWSSDAGQRIGAASEIEGGGSPTTQTLSTTNTGTGTGTVVSSPAGINCTTSCSVAFTSDSTVTLTATASGGSAFVGWSGDCSGSGSCSVLMTGAKSVTATFNTTPVSGGGGIAQGYPFDVNIASDPAVIWADNFEGTIASIHGNYNGWQGASGETSVSADVPSVSGGTQSLLFAPANGSIASTLYRQLPSNYSTLYMRYYVKYSGTGYHHSGGYMGGYSPTSTFPQGDAGYKGVREDGTSKLLISSLEATNGIIDTYDNFVGMQGQAFNGLWYGRNYLGSYQIPILPGQWQCVEFMTKLNTASGNSDGELSVWINGQLIVNFHPGAPVGTYDSVSGAWLTGAGSGFPGFQWRDTTSYGINWIKLQNYDDDGTPTQMRVDDLVVATSYIGPINTGNTGPTARTGGISGKIRGNGKVRFSAP